jgi:adenylate cyclase
MIIMKKIILLQFLFFLFFELSAQTELDSLWAVWEDKTKPDSTRANAFNDYIYEGYFYSQPDSAILLTDQLYKFTEDVDYKIGMVDALKMMGYIYFRIGNYPKAFASYRKGLNISEKIDYKRGTAYILLRTGYIYHDNEDIISALNYYQKSLKVFEEIDDLVGISSVYNEFGSIYLDKKEYTKSLDYYQKSLAITDELDDEIGNASILYNIGNLYLEQKDFQKALNIYQKSLAVAEKIDDKLGIATGLAGIGLLYSDQGDDNKALEYFRRSLNISEQIGDVQGSSSSLLNIGYIHAIQGRYSKSIENCKKSLALAKDLGDIGGQQASCECLYIAFKAIGKVNKALVYHEQMLLFSDSMKMEETAEKIQQMEFSKQMLADSLVQVEKDLKLKMDHKVEVQRKDKNRNLAIGAGIFFLLLSAGFFSRWRYIKKSKAIIEKEKNRSESLLLNILPASIAEELKEKGEAAARDFELVSILFTDFKNYTEKSEKLSAKELVGEINHCFKAFDHICEKYGIEKIKTIGDAYMAAGGLPVPSDKSVQNTVLAALDMQSFITDRTAIKKARNEISFEMRLGIHTGPVVAGIVGVKKFQYDIWGDTVNIASRMESGSEIGKVNISQFTYEFIKNDPQFTFENRGIIHVKGKGEMEMWFVEKA